MAFAYPLIQLAPFSLGLHSSSKLSSPVPHSWPCTAKFTSINLYLDITCCWLFTIGKLLSNFKTQTKSWTFPHPNPTKTTGNLWMPRSGGEKHSYRHFPTAPLVAIHSLHLLPPWDVQSLHGYHQMLAWQSGIFYPEKLGDAGMLSQKCQVESWNLSASWWDVVSNWSDDYWWMGEMDRTFQFTDTKSALITNFFSLSEFPILSWFL